MDYLKIINCKLEFVEVLVNAFFLECAKDHLKIVNTKFHVKENDEEVTVFIQYRQL